MLLAKRFTKHLTYKTKHFTSRVRKGGRERGSRSCGVMHDIYLLFAPALEGSGVGLLSDSGPRFRNIGYIRPE